MNRKYKIITLDLQKSLIEFLDEIQFDAAKEGTTDDMQKVNFCSYAIKELMDSLDGYLKDKPRDKNIKPQSKTRDTYVEETFMDWNLPDMSDEDYEKLVDQFDAFLRGWEKEYKNKNPKKNIKDRPKKDFKPRLDDVVEYCSLDEIVDMLKDDPELTDNERFELYYDERERRKPEEKGLTYNQLLKKAGIKPSAKK